MKISIMITAVILAVYSSVAVAQQNLTGETATPGGVPYLAMSHLGEIAARNKIANIQILPGQTLTNALQNVAEGKADIASAVFTLPFLMSKGIGPYAALGEEKGAELASQCAVLYSYVLGGMTLYAYDSVGLKGWKDLKNRTVLNGPPRGAALTNARNLIQFVTGYKDKTDYAGLQANWGQMTSVITDGSVDAVVLPMLFPDARITPALASGDITIWSVPKDVFETEAFQRFTRAPGAAPFLRDRSVAEYSEGVTLVSEDDTLRAVATVGGDVVNVSMDFETAKALTAAFISSLDELRARAPIAANVGFGNTDEVGTSMCGHNPLKYHPGAVAAWEEAGYTIPDCAKP